MSSISYYIIFLFYRSFVVHVKRTEQIKSLQTIKNRTNIIFNHLVKIQYTLVCAARLGDNAVPGPVPVPHPVVGQSYRQVALTMLVKQEKGTNNSRQVALIMLVKQDKSTNNSPLTMLVKQDKCTSNSRQLVQPNRNSGCMYMNFHFCLGTISRPVASQPGGGGV